jgi:hypothetical protein
MASLSQYASHLDFDAGMVEQLLEQLTLLYAQMEPSPATTQSESSRPH